MIFLLRRAQIANGAPQHSDGAFHIAKFLKAAQSGVFALAKFLAILLTGGTPSTGLPMFSNRSSRLIINAGRLAGEWAAWNDRRVEALVRYLNLIELHDGPKKPDSSVLKRLERVRPVPDQETLRWVSRVVRAVLEDPTEPPQTGAPPDAEPVDEPDADLLRSLLQFRYQEKLKLVLVDRAFDGEPVCEKLPWADKTIQQSILCTTLLGWEEVLGRLYPARLKRSCIGQTQAKKFIADWRNVDGHTFPSCLRPDIEAAVWKCFQAAMKDDPKGAVIIKRTEAEVARACNALMRLGEVPKKVALSLLKRRIPPLLLSLNQISSLVAAKKVRKSAIRSAIGKAGNRKRWG